MSTGSRRNKHNKRMNRQPLERMARGETSKDRKLEERAIRINDLGRTTDLGEPMRMREILASREAIYDEMFVRSNPDLHTLADEEELTDAQVDSVLREVFPALKFASLEERVAVERFRETVRTVHRQAHHDRMTQKRPVVDRSNQNDPRWEMGEKLAEISPEIREGTPEWQAFMDELIPIVERDKADDANPEVQRQRRISLAQSHIRRSVDNRDEVLKILDANQVPMLKVPSVFVSSSYADYCQTRSAGLRGDVDYIDFPSLAECRWPFADSPALFIFERPIVLEFLIVNKVDREFSGEARTKYATEGVPDGYFDPQQVLGIYYLPNHLLPNKMFKGGSRWQDQHGRRLDVSQASGDFEKWPLVWYVHPYGKREERGLHTVQHTLVTDGSWGFGAKIQRRHPERISSNILFDTVFCGEMQKSGRLFAPDRGDMSWDEANLMVNVGLSPGQKNILFLELDPDRGLWGRGKSARFN
jgi:hypothetical protein